MLIRLINLKQSILKINLVDKRQWIQELEKSLREHLTAAITRFDPFNPLPKLKWEPLLKPVSLKIHQMQIALQTASTKKIRKLNKL